MEGRNYLREDSPSPLRWHAGALLDANNQGHEGVRGDRDLLVARPMSWQTRKPRHAILPRKNTADWRRLQRRATPCP